MFARCTTEHDYNNGTVYVVWEFEFHVTPRFSGGWASPSEGGEVELLDTPYPIEVVYSPVSGDRVVLYPKDGSLLEAMVLAKYTPPNEGDEELVEAALEIPF
jgi:hypothetical protein